MRRVVALASAAALVLAFVSSVPAGAFSTNGNCLGLVAQSATVELNPGDWAVGSHTVAFRAEDPMFDSIYAPDPVTIVVDSRAPLYAGQVHIGEAGAVWGQELLDRINPAQDTVLWSGWFWDMTGEIFGIPSSTMQDVRAEAGQMWAGFSIDGGAWITARLTPPRSVCANGLLSGLTPMPLMHRTWGPAH